MSKRDNITNEMIIEALRASSGFMSVAATKLKVSRGSLYKWANDDDELKEEIESITESLIDYSESQLMILIKEKNPAAIFFHLKCKGKHRGYIERQEIEVGDGSSFSGGLNKVRDRIKSNPELAAQLDKELLD